MKVIVNGSRTIKKYKQVEECIEKAITEHGITITELVSGKCRGPDTLAETWALKKGIPIKDFPADWNRYGISAGLVRNCQMVDYAEVLISIWDGKSKGTKHTIDYAKKKGIPVIVYIVDV